MNALATLRDLDFVLHKEGLTMTVVSHRTGRDRGGRGVEVRFNDGRRTVSIGYGRSFLDALIDAFVDLERGR